MSTRSTTHFQKRGKTQAIVYRHSDGYPEGHGRDLDRFFADVESQTKDTRFNDPTYLAAKLIVWLAPQFSIHSYSAYTSGDAEAYAREHPLDFLSVGVCLVDPGDIEYQYRVHCDRMDERGRPEVECFGVVDTGVYKQIEIAEIREEGSA